MELILGSAIAASHDFDRVARELKRNNVAGIPGLEPAVRTALAQAVERWKPRGRFAYVLLLPPNQPLPPWRRLWGSLGLQTGTDLLLLFNGKRWEAKGWGLSPRKIGVALNSAEPVLQEGRVEGIRTALGLLAEMSLRPSHLVTEREGAGRSDPTIKPWAVFGAGGLVVFGLVAFVVVRRMRRAREGRGEFDEACEDAKERFGEVMLATDGLARDDVSELQLRAAEHLEALDLLVEKVEKKEEKPSDPLILGKVRQIESEFATLRSAILRKQREG